MDINAFIPAVYSQMKQAEARTAYGVEVMKKSLDVQRSTGAWAVDLLTQNPVSARMSAEETGKGRFIDAYL